MLKIIISKLTVLINKNDFKKFLIYKLHVDKNKYKYVRFWKNGKKVCLHREIMNAKPCEIVDHINGNTLDNRRENLRICSRAENIRNSIKRSKCSSKYKGVCFVKNRNSKKKWKCGIDFNKTSIFLGYFLTEIEAAEAYNRAAIKYHKKFANLNKIR